MISTIVNVSSVIDNNRSENEHDVHCEGDCCFVSAMRHDRND